MDLYGYLYSTMGVAPTPLPHTPLLLQLFTHLCLSWDLEHLYYHEPDCPTGFLVIRSCMGSTIILEM